MRKGRARVYLNFSFCEIQLVVIHALKPCLLSAFRAFSSLKKEDSGKQSIAGLFLLLGQ